jgi:hypothetical protein
MTVQYLVTVTTADDTFHWLFSDKADAQRLIDLGHEFGGDNVWEVQPMLLDYPVESAFGIFKDIVEED